MVALLKKAFSTVSFWTLPERAPEPCATQGSYPEELTDDQVAYLHERAAERRRAWAEHAASVAKATAE